MSGENRIPDPGQVVLGAVDQIMNKKLIKSALENWRKCHNFKTLVHMWGSENN